MTRIITLHSFRRGTGKSNVIVNIASLLAMDGMRVGVIDANLKAPSAHIFFELAAENVRCTWADIFMGTAKIEDIVYDVTPEGDRYGDGKIFLVPASLKANESIRALSHDFQMQAVNKGLQAIGKVFDLDVILLDSYAGISGETLVSLVVADALHIVMRLDKQDYQGSGLVADIGRQLGVADITLLVNDVPNTYDFSSVAEQLRENYEIAHIRLFPHSPAMLAFASRGIFVEHFPDDPLTKAYQAYAKTLKIP